MMGRVSLLRRRCRCTVVRMVMVVRVMVMMERARVGSNRDGVTLPDPGTLALLPVVVLNPAILSSHTVMAGPPPPRVTHRTPLPLPLQLHTTLVVILAARVGHGKTDSDESLGSCLVGHPALAISQHTALCGGRGLDASGGNAFTTLNDRLLHRVGAMRSMKLEVETTRVADVVTNIVAPPEWGRAGPAVGTGQGTDASRGFSLLSNHICVGVIYVERGRWGTSLVGRLIRRSTVLRRRRGMRVRMRVRGGLGRRVRMRVALMRVGGGRWGLRVSREGEGRGMGGGGNRRSIQGRSRVD